MNLIRSGLWLGNSSDARDVLNHSKDDTWFSINCAFDLDIVCSSLNTRMFKVGLVDGPGNKQSSFNFAVDLLEYIDNIRGKDPLLIHCHVGASRSAGVLATYLAKKENKSTEEILKELKLLRSIVDPKPAILSLMSNYEIHR